MYRLSCSMRAPAAITDIFRVFEDPRNLSKITPAWLNFRILDSGSVNMRAGAEIDYEIRWLGLPFRWKTIIAEYLPPYKFVDEQERGPYASWRHTHTFEESTEGVTIGDQVDYELPLGVAGRIAHAIVVRRQLLSIFRYRQREIAKLLAVPGIAFDDPSIIYL